LIHILLNYSSGIKVRRELLDTIAYAAVRHLGYDDRDLSIACESDEAVQELNQQYRGINQPTDVLSFPSGEVDPHSGRVYLGDVIISLPAVSRQAQDLGHDFQTELAAVVIHGILHLAGYDHSRKAEKEEMFALQERILAGLNLNEARAADFFSTFTNAARGLVSAFQTENNLKIHTAFGLLAVLLGWLLGISRVEWALLTLVISAVFAAEFINTALEYVVNLASPRYHDLARKAKDISAAAVLIVVCASLVIGALLFLPKLIPLASGFFNP